MGRKRSLRGRLDDRWLRWRLRWRPFTDYDPAFYARRNRDLAGLDDVALARHWLRHGRVEGRAGTPDALLAALVRTLGALPADFEPGLYRALYPDIGPLLDEDWEATAHYLEFGRPEERPYRIETAGLAEDFRALLAARGETAPPDAFAAFLAQAGLPAGAWLARFDLAEFGLLNADWIGRPLVSRADGIGVFVAQGIARLAPLAMGLAFDPAFYRAQDRLDGVDDAALYRDWLARGLHQGRAPNEAARLLELTGSSVFPEVFDAAAYRAALPGSLPPPGPGRLAALEHAFAVGFPHGLDPFGAAQLYEAVGDYHRVRSQHAVALRAYDRALAASPGTARLLERRGTARGELGDAAGAAADLVAASEQPGATAGGAVRGARALAALGRHAEALDLMMCTAVRGAPDPAWREAARATVAGLFEAESEAARALYAVGRRTDADAAMTALLERIAEAWPALAPLPAPLPPARTGRIAILANLDLPQCVHYRVEQRRRQLEAGGWRVAIHDGGDVDAFRETLHGADAAIVYRVPAFPEVVRAILYARALGLPTFYEIDDLVFDTDAYPEPFDHFEGAITPDAYVGLLYGVPLFCFALALCDAGIASTPALAERMAPLTRSGVCHVVRNGLDERNRPFLARDRPPEGAWVTVAYGSGTRAHNRDFSERAAPALLAALAAHPRVRLLVVGHLPDDSRFDAYRDRVRRLEFTADVDAYWRVLAAADINLAVLAPSAAADAKSEIKWLEAANLGIPSIVSPTRTYREVLVDGIDVLFAETPEDWTAALDSLVRDADLRRRIGATARAKARAAYGIEHGVAALAGFLPRPQRLAPARPRTKRVLLVNVFFPPHVVGGATRVVRDNVDYLIDHAGDRLDLAAAATEAETGPLGATRIDGYRGRPVLRIATPAARDLDRRPTDAATGAAFDGFLDRFAPDLVHFHCVQRLTASVVDAARLRGVPHVVTVHDGWWLSDYQFLVDGDGLVRIPSDDPLGDAPASALDPLASITRRLRLAETLRGATRILAVSETFAALYRRAGFPGTLALPNGVPPLVPVPRVPTGGGRVRLGHVGGRSTHKGATLVEAVLRATPFANLSLTIVDLAHGPEYARHETWGTTPVTIVGRVSEAAMPGLYAGLDVLLAPSLWPESFGLVAREARALGLWVVASDRGAMAEDVAEGRDGFVVDVGSPAGLRRALERIDADPARFRAPLLPGPARTADDQGAELLALYDRLLAS